ncbi:MAG: DNA-directed RNA polymerase subunit beta [Armatimonadota bacterium]|jgi:DNA-directed RNA polymerase subunit beta
MAENLPKLPESRPLSYDPAALPDLISIQTESYAWFREHGLKELFDSFSPIEDYTGNIALEFLDYTIGEPSRSMTECRERDATYEAPLYVKVRLINKEIPEITESEVYLGELPIMTDRGKFIINGAKRVVISQLARSPGVYFSDTIDTAGRVRFSAKVIPSDGAWLEIDTAANGVISVKLGQTRKFPVTALLRALQWLETDAPEGVSPTGTDEEILHTFGEEETADVKALIKRIEEREAEALPGIEAHEEYFTTRTLSDQEGEILAEAWEALGIDVLKKLSSMGVKKLTVIKAPFELRATLEDDESTNAEQGLLEVYRKIRPGDPPTVDSAESLLHSYFFDVKRYDLSRVGRYKINRKLGVDVDPELRTLTRQDVVAMVRYLLGLPRDEGEVDDIDHLQNKRVRAVGELLQSQLRTGFMRTERVAKERMTSMDPEEMVPGNVISTKPISAAINSFFGSGQLSQFMDEVNPLAELSHTRRVSALGPGGLSKQSAKLEVRDVHHSHYGRICPVQSPEGQLVGLTGYLALHARLNEFGFLQSPYRKVVDGMPTDEVVYMTADEEEQYYIASASAERDSSGRLSGPINCRYRGRFATMQPEEVEYIDYSASQVFSIAPGLIPFLEHDDAVRALAGSNMERQAVPLIKTDAPCVRSGLERRAAEDSGVVALAAKDGRVTEANAKRVVVEYVDGTVGQFDLENFVRTNMGTCVTSPRLVRAGEMIKAGQPLADGPSTHKGEIALGNDLRVCFLPWEGYNFEDSIVISERLLHDDELTSVHIEKYECEARDTKLGPEEITRDIPNVGDDALADLDSTGVVRIGAEVRAEDILVGKVAPKGKSELTAEEKLVIAIFGKKAEEMRDVSLRVPHGEKGIVIDTKVFSRHKYECKSCGIVHDFGKQPEHERCPRCDGKLEKLAGDELKPGVNQLVRVFVAQRRKIMVGDKLTGRHGNKGVISRILPIEDMPYTADGRPVDICLNPMTVPSRMNIGQVMETHLALIAKETGREYVTPIFEGITAADIMEGMAALSIQQKREALIGYADCELNHFGEIINAEALDAPTPEGLEQQIIEQLSQHEPDELEQLAEWLCVSPYAWSRASGDRPYELIMEAARENAYLRAQLDPETGKTVLYDGRSGEQFNQPVMVGYMYILKLLQLVEDKIHARSTGPYSLITQQPLGGKAQFGGQRFGEMEVWALEAYGAASCLQEMLTVKSDDVAGRVATYEAIVKDQNIDEPGVPEAFKILVNEMRALALDVSIEDREGEPMDISSNTADLR